MRLSRLAGAMVGLSCMLPRAAASQVASRPAEVQQLQFYVGHWNETGEMREDPNQPFMDVAGGETCKWSAGGYAVLCEERTEGLFLPAIGLSNYGKVYHTNTIIYLHRCNLLILCSNLTQYHFGMIHAFSGFINTIHFE